MKIYYPTISKRLLLLTTLPLLLIHAAWVPVAYDMVDSTSLNLNSHINPWAGAFSSSKDGFEKYTRGVSSSIPGCMLDDSLLGVDTLGLVDSTITGEFFGFADTENNQNAGPVTCTWEFDITGETITAIQLDAAELGDFEETGSYPDWFNWRASIDGGPQTIIFQGVADGSLSLQYTLADGSLVELLDPMMLNGNALSNAFETYVASYSGQGSVLTLELEAHAAGSNEATAFRNIKVLADDGGPTAAPTALETCPKEFCSNEVATTMTPTTSGNCNLAAVTFGIDRIR